MKKGMIEKRSLKGNRMKRWMFLALVLLAGCSYLPDSLDTAGVTITESREAVLLEPSSVSASSTGLLFYPGGLVDPHVYLEILSLIAKEGVPVVIAKMPSNLAVLDSAKALSLIGRFPGVSGWVIGGHSLGGAMAASVIHDNPSTFKGLVLLAAYPADSSSIADWTGHVLSVSASEDGLATPAKISNTVGLLPPGKWLSATDSTYPSASGGYTVFIRIEGGCHAQFGSYGPQDGDGTPTLTRGSQHTQTAQAVLGFFSTNSWR